MMAKGNEDVSPSTNNAIWDCWMCSVEVFVSLLRCRF